MKTEKPQCLRVLRKDVTMLATNLCGNRCKHCRPESGKRISDEMCSSEFAIAIRNVENLFGTRRIALSGGEPLLRDGFELLYAEAINRFEVTLFSSGLGLTARLEELFRSRPPKHFITSIYGMPSSHDNFTRRIGAFADTERSLNFFHEIPTDTIVNIICHRDNLEQIPELIDWLWGKGLVDGIKILAFSPLGRGKDIMSLAVDAPLWLSFTERLRNHAMKKYPHLASAIEVERHVRLIPTSNARPTECAVASDRNGVFSSCVHIDATGDIYPCVMLLRDLRFKIGNILRPEDIVMKTYYQQVEEACRMVRVQNCEDCLMKASCHGGCLGYHVSLGRDYRCGTGTFDLGCPTRYQPLIEQGG